MDDLSSECTHFNSNQPTRQYIVNYTFCEKETCSCTLQKWCHMPAGSKVCSTGASERENVTRQLCVFLASTCPP
jgi:hypothetical protein